MPIESSIAPAPFMAADMLWLLSKGGILTLSVLYFIFSLVVVRQVNLMTETVMTKGAPVLRAFSIIHAGLALGIIILFIGFLFG